MLDYHILSYRAHTSIQTKHKTTVSQIQRQYFSMALPQNRSHNETTYLLLGSVAPKHDLEFRFVKKPSSGYLLHAHYILVNPEASKIAAAEIKKESGHVLSGSADLDHEGLRLSSYISERTSFAVRNQGVYGQ